MMSRLLCAALILAALATPCLAQTGMVIFYTDADTAKSDAASLLPKSQQPFTGWLFDGPERLAHVRAGRFMAFHLRTGVHVFTAPWHSDKPGRNAFAINLKDGSQHCVHLSAKETNYEVLPIGSHESQMEEVPCQVAQKNAANLKLIEMDRVDAGARSKLDASTTFPGDSQTHP